MVVIMITVPGSICFAWFSIEEFPQPFYYYDNDWRDKVVDSSKFYITDGHENPSKLPFNSQTYISDSVRIGAYYLSKELKEKFNDFVIITSDERPERRDIKMHAGLYYHTSDVWNPQIGDIRLQFSYAGKNGDIVSIIGNQKGNVISGEKFLILEKGKISPEDIISKLNRKRIWILRASRFFGWLAVYAGCTCFSSVFLNFGKYSDVIFSLPVEINQLALDEFIKSKVTLGRRYKKIYLFFTLENRLSPNFSLATLMLGFIIGASWVVYEPWISGIIMFTFASPFFTCFIYKEIKTFNIEENKKE